MNNEVTINITGLTHQGEGVGRLPDGLAVFVPGVVPGEMAQVKIIQRKKNFARAKLLHILQATADRCQPECSVFSECGGCTLQHVNYQAQLTYKRQQVVDNLTRIGKLSEVNVESTLGMDNPWHYRNKVHFQVQQINGGIRLGYFEQGSHHFLPLTPHYCQLVDEDLNDTAKQVEMILNKHKVSVYNWRTKSGLLRHVLLRKAVATDQIMVVLVTGRGSWYNQKLIAADIQKLQPKVVSVIRNINKASNRVVLGDENITLAGQATITDKLANLYFEISPNSFYQVNPVQTQLLYQKALEYAELNGNEKVLDAYCGIGTIALFMAGHAKEVMGLEVVPQAVENAKENAARNGVSNAEFYQGEVERMLPLMYKEGYRPGVVVLDPPRKGCEPEVLQTITQMQVPRIVYVSCDSSTMSRDIAYLHENGYQARKVQPVDMFPHTAHVETVVLMSRK
ncbi:23S rRNA (uracil(1939)-C(5))-methyltransferase RlmD [Peptococcaceae bacterium 1198_IL3148]